MGRFLKICALILCTVTVLLSVPAQSVFAYGYGDDEKSPYISTVEINVDFGSDVPSKLDYSEGRMKITLAENYSEYENYYTGSGMRKIQIRARGNSTYGMNDVRRSGKYSYRMVLDRKCDLFGLGASDEWYLLANYYDATHLRNKVAYDFSATIGMYYTASTWVRLKMNGRDMGLYQITQTLDIGKDKVDIPDWGDIAEDVAYSIAKKEDLSQGDAQRLAEAMKADLSWVTSGSFNGYPIRRYYDIERLDITSGYFIEYDDRYQSEGAKFRTKVLGVPIQFDDPANIGTNPRMVDYVETLVNEFEEAVLSKNGYNTKGKHYSEYVDVDSMVDYWLVFNLFKNIEFGVYSNFLYINEGKIYFGPCWDFDNGSNNQLTLRPEWTPADEWFNMKSRAKWWRELYDDPYFVSKIRERWFEVAPAVEEMIYSLDLYYEVIKEDANHDFALFNAERENWKYPNSSCHSFYSEFSIFKTFMKNRVRWLNDQLSKEDPKIEGTSLVDSDIFDMVLSDGSEELAKDRITVFGSPSDHLISPDKKKITLSLKSDDVHLYKIYVNGIMCESVTAIRGDGKISLDTKLFDMEENAVNVITVHAHKSSGGHLGAVFRTIRVSSDENPENNGNIIIAKFGDRRIYVKKGESITVPEIDREMSDVTAAAWISPDGEILAPGQKISFDKNGEFYVKWERNDALTFPSSINGKRIEKKDNGGSLESLLESVSPILEGAGRIFMQISFVSLAFTADSFAVACIFCGMLRIKSRKNQKQKIKKQRKRAKKENINGI